MMNDSSRQQQQQSGGRPQYHRGVTAPIYQRRTDTHQSPHNDPMRLASLAGLSRIDESARAPALTGIQSNLQCSLFAIILIPTYLPPPFLLQPLFPSQTQFGARWVLQKSHH